MVIALLVAVIVLVLINNALTCAVLAKDYDRAEREEQQRVWDKAGAEFAEMLRRGPLNG